MNDPHPISPEQEASDDAWAAELFAAARSPQAPGDDGSTLLTRYQRRRQRGRALSGVGAVLLLLALSFGFPGRSHAPDLTPRGAGDALGNLQLSAVLDADTLREVRTVPATERIVFAVQTPRAGFLCLQEQQANGWRTVFPAQGESWKVDPGRHLPTVDGAAQSYRPDDGTGARSYRALLDPTSASCEGADAISTLSLRWLP